jgi:hypothetical protein
VGQTTLRMYPEMIPDSCVNSEIRGHMSSSQFNEIKKEVFKKANNKCEICGGVGPKWPVELSEVFDYSKGVQTLLGLKALCPDCNLCKKLGFAKGNGHGDRVLDHLQKVNDIDKETAKTLVEQSLAINDALSQKLWSLDLSFLEQYGINKQLTFSVDSRNLIKRT